MPADPLPAHALQRRHAGTTIVAIAGPGPAPLHAQLGERLARLRRRAGHRVLLVDATLLGDAAGDYDDVLVDAGGCAARDCCCALAAAQVALVPVAPGDADPVRNYGLIARLNAARMANPGLRVLFVALGDGAPQALRAVQAYAREVMSGHVAATVLDAAALRDDGSLAALGDEVFGHRH